MQKIDAIQKDIFNGNVYEVNLSHQIQMNIKTNNPFEIYQNLRQTNPAPYSAFVKNKNDYILCSSPERFFTRDNDTITLSPIKGTRPRGKNKAEDKKHLEDLQSSPKDQAENLMIADLIRNDIGKICEFGSVIAKKLLDIETYSHVFQLVSTITGTLKKDITFSQIIAAIFPGGSMTGAPKINAMKVIEREEIRKRGLYAGSIGYFSLDQTKADCNIVIRTVLLKHKQDNQYTASIDAGGAIVHDSHPQEEWNETITKAQCLIELITQYIVV